jgi:chemotaxis methyl-accepting protein methylase
LRQQVCANCRNTSFIKRSIARGRFIASSRATVKGSNFCIRTLRKEALDRLFDLILCCYVAFTYFAEALQRQVLTRLIDRLAPHGYLTIGTHEQLPIGAVTLQLLPGAPHIFTRETEIRR